MRSMFSEASEFEGIGLDKWDVSNVTNVSAMFNKCRKFNCNLSSWNVSKVTNMSYMFYGCSEFNADLSGWDTSNVENMSYMFMGCSKLKCDLSGWDVSKVGPLHTHIFRLATKMKPHLRPKPSW